MRSDWLSSLTRKKMPKGLVLLGLIFSVFYWFIDSAFDYFILNRTPFYDTLLAPGYHELLMRCQVILIIILSYFFYKSPYTRGTNKDKIEVANQILEVIFENTYVLFAYLDRNINFVHVNRAFSRIIDKEPAFCQGKNYFDLFPNPGKKELFNRVLTTGIPHYENGGKFEFEGSRLKDDSYFDWGIIPIVNIKGEVAGLVLSFSDVTESKKAKDMLEKAVSERTSDLTVLNDRLTGELRERKKVENSLKTNNDLLGYLTEIQSNFITREGGEALFNSLLQKILALTESDFGIIGELKEIPGGGKSISLRAVCDSKSESEPRKPLIKFAFSELEVRNNNNLITEVIESGQFVISNSPELNPKTDASSNGFPPVTSLLGMPIYNGSKLTGIIAIANKTDGYDEKTVEYLDPLRSACGSIIESLKNIERRKEAADNLNLKERELRNAKKMDAIGKPTAGVAHDFNNMLTVINGNSENILSDIEHGNPLRVEIEEINGAAEKSATLTRQRPTARRR